MPLMKIRSSDGSQWKTIDSLTFKDIELKTGIIKTNNKGLFIDNDKTAVATQSWVESNYKTSAQVETYVKDQIESNNPNINAEYVTHFEEIVSTNDGINLSPNNKYNDYNLFNVTKLKIAIGEAKKIHAFMNFSGDNPTIEYSSTISHTIKGDDASKAKKGEIWELDIYIYNEKQYIIWKNWSATE